MLVQCLQLPSQEGIVIRIVLIQQMRLREVKQAAQVSPASERLQTSLLFLRLCGRKEGREGGRRGGREEGSKEGALGSTQRPWQTAC